jgi:transcriptional regulator with XRE-family HTH domain
MRVADLLVTGLKQARQRKGYTLEAAAAAFRAYGLPTWRTGTVSQMEAGLRIPKLEELLLMCAALDVTLDELFPGEDERVDVGRSSAATPRAIRALLSRSAPRCAALVPGGSPVIPSDTDRHAARRLGLTAAEVARAARALWGRDFAAERDARLGGVSGLPPRSLQARRGLVSREMLAELRRSAG